MTPNEIVASFCKNIATDPEGSLNLLADDCFYHNIPLEPIQGLDNIKQFFGGFSQLLSGMRWEVLNQVADGDIVMNERVDYFTLAGKTEEFGLPVTGVFEVKNNKIVAWRDYFDVKQFEEGLGIKL